MKIEPGSYFYEILESGEIDWTAPGRITEYPAIDGQGQPRPDYARVEWPGLPPGVPLEVKRLYLVTDGVAADAAATFTEEKENAA